MTVDPNRDSLLLLRNDILTIRPNRNELRKACIPSEPSCRSSVCTRFYYSTLQWQMMTARTAAGRASPGGCLRRDQLARPTLRSHLLGGDWSAAAGPPSAVRATAEAVSITTQAQIVTLIIVVEVLESSLGLLPSHKQTQTKNRFGAISNTNCSSRRRWPSYSFRIILYIRLVIQNSSAALLAGVVLIQHDTPHSQWPCSSGRLCNCYCGGSQSHLPAGPFLFFVNRLCSE